MSLTPSASRGGGAHDPGPVPGHQPVAESARTRARRYLPRVVLAAAILMGTAGCTENTFTRLGLPAPITKQGQVIINLWQGSWLAAWAVGAVVWGMIVWAILFHRKRAGQPISHQVRYNLPIEMLYTVVPIIMVGVLFFFTARDENYVDALPAHPQVRVTVVGYQWSWQFLYPQYQVPGATPDVVTENGYPWSPTAGNSQLPELVIPTGESVQFDLVSTDVVHAFWVDPFEFKRDVIPGHPNHFTVTATKTGYWIGRCTELCGLYHSRMLFKIKIVTPAHFSQWIHAQQAAQTKAAGSSQ